MAFAGTVCAGCAAKESPRLAPLSFFTAIATERPEPAEPEQPSLYVGSHKLSEYTLGSSDPLHSTPLNYNVNRAVLSLDHLGNLIEANGNPSYAQMLVYDAHTLKLIHTFGGVGYFYSLVANKSGYLYAGPESYIVVFAPGSARVVGKIRRGARSVGPLIFDGEGNLYAGNMEGSSVSIYAPKGSGWDMKFVRSVQNGVHSPIALAVGPSGELYVANWPPRKRGWVTVYPAGASKPARKISSGINTPLALAVDSDGMLYVGNVPQSGHLQLRGWVSVYPSGSSQPLRRVTDGIYTPASLALAPSGDLYVGNLYAGAHKGPHGTVTVYEPGASRLLYTIKKGIDTGPMIMIGSPQLSAYTGGAGSGTGNTTSSARDVTRHASASETP